MPYIEDILKQYGFLIKPFATVSSTELADFILTIYDNPQAFAAAQVLQSANMTITRKNDTIITSYAD